MTIHTGHVEGRHVLVVPALQVRVRVASELGSGGGVASHAGVVQGSQPVLVFLVQIRPVLTQTKS